MTLPRLFDAERGFRFLRGRPSDRAQFGGAAHRPVHEEPVDDGIEPKGHVGIVQQELVGYIAAEAIAPARLVEAQEVVAIAAGLDRPHLADQSVAGESVWCVHRGPPELVSYCDAI